MNSLMLTGKVFLFSALQERSTPEFIASNLSFLLVTVSFDTILGGSNASAFNARWIKPVS